MDKNRSFENASKAVVEQIIDDLRQLSDLADNNEYAYNMEYIDAVLEKIRDYLGTVRYHYSVNMGILSDRHRKPNQKNGPKSVYNVTTRTAYKSVKDASSLTGINAGRIYHCIAGYSGSAGKCHWRYLSEEEAKSYILLEV